ncbi:phytase [Rhodocollybia butyracea]|uniref:Phytase A n=1 Tax=Rhodocollybia butyracea TaxID=206335 RepID=A0A9P5Q4J7_9AGAR|nr:phytase [Rhodocollybia butyracea]
MSSMDKDKQPSLTMGPSSRGGSELKKLKANSSRSLGWTIVLLILTTTLAIYLFPEHSPLQLTPWTISSSHQQNKHPFAYSHYWGAYSPYYAVEEYRSPPEGCQVTQVNIIQRHGSRYPTVGPALIMAYAVTKLQNVEVYLDSGLEFIRDFTFDLETDELVPFGATESSVAGAEAFYRYRHLLSRDNIPFVRASSSSRVVNSARNWTEGFSIASGFQYNPILDLVLDAKRNDSLHNYCPAIGSPDSQTSTWINIYAKPIADRLNEAAPGANLTSIEVYYLMALCAFHSVAKATASDWCGVFDEEAWKGFEYAMDLDKYYGTGYGQTLGPVEGVGYINELLARLTSTPVNDTTQTNTTLNASPATFPLNRTIYADFSHDNQLIAIFSAMGLFRQKTPLDPERYDADPSRTWITSQLTPFGGRMVVERMLCASAKTQTQTLTDGTQYVRVLVNNAVQPLEFCTGVTADGLCALDKFVESQGYATGGGGGDWEKCFE